MCVRQDVALPFIASDRFESDTLFLVFENDFRFRESDDEEPEVRSAESLRAAGHAAPAAVAPLQPGERAVRKTKHIHLLIICFPSWTCLTLMFRMLVVQSM